MVRCSQINDHSVSKAKSCRRPEQKSRAHSGFIFGIIRASAFVGRLGLVWVHAAGELAITESDPHLCPIFNAYLVLTPNLFGLKVRLPEVNTLER
jgi:hypothetical protein